jgi:hypothetical protein
MLHDKFDCFARTARAKFCGLGASIALLAATAPVAPAAGVIVDTNGFDSPYVVGDLVGQQDWVTAALGGTSSATVQDSVGDGGGRGLTVTRQGAPNTDRRWFVPTTDYPTQRFVTVDWDMRVEGPSGNLLNGEFGPFFGVDTYDADTAVFVLGTLGVDATTGDVLYQAQTSGALTETGSVADFGEWNHFRIVLDFATDTYRGFFNGVQVVATGFVDGGFGLDNFTDADIATFAAAPDAASMALPGTAYFDNFLIRDGLLGDYDIDGDVDAADYQRWRATFGTAVTAGHDADGNGNGVVDAADFVVWRDNLGATLFGGAGSGAQSLSTAVPEPASLTLLLAGLFGLLGRRAPR